MSWDTARGARRAPKPTILGEKVRPLRVLLKQPMGECESPALSRQERECNAADGLVQANTAVREDGGLDEDASDVADAKGEREAEAMLAGLKAGVLERLEHIRAMQAVLRQPAGAELATHQLCGDADAMLERFSLSLGRFTSSILQTGLDLEPAATVETAGAEQMVETVEIAQGGGDSRARASAEAEATAMQEQLERAFIENAKKDAEVRLARGEHTQQKAEPCRLHTKLAQSNAAGRLELEPSAAAVGKAREGHCESEGSNRRDWGASEGEATFVGVAITCSSRLREPELGEPELGMDSDSAQSTTPGHDPDGLD